MTSKLRIGYIPLLDSVLVHVAAHLGFAEEHGLELELVRETSWANIRDKLALRIFDAAHMLAPAAIASSLGLSHFEAPMVAPIALNLDGNAITLSLPIHAALMDALDGSPTDPAATAKALRRVIDQRAARGQTPLKFAHVFPFSAHHYQLRLWLKAGRIDPDQDLRLIVVPPPYMATSLEQGLVDGFCVGAPWNSIAQDAGIGRVLHPCSDIVADCPEKVLAFRATWAETKVDMLERAALAIQAASRWASDPTHLEDLATLAATHIGFDIAPAQILQILGRDPNAPLGWIRLDPPAVNLCDRQAIWIYDQMVAAGQVQETAENRQKAMATYRSDMGAGGRPPLPVAFKADVSGLGVRHSLNDPSA